MKYLVTGKEMKLLDQNTSDFFHVPGEVLMEQAAMGFVQELFSIREKMNRVLILCGNGNNGADGIAVARLLNQCGVFASIYYAMGEKGSPLFELQNSIYHAYNYEIADDKQLCLEQYDVIVDAIFGIGLSRPLHDDIKELLQKVNNANTFRVALDMPSGISADSGEVLGYSFKANATITFSFAKLGQLLWPGNEWCGDVHVVDIGITKESFRDKKPHYAFLDREDFSLLPIRKAHSNKGTFGKLLLIAGSENMAGSAALAAKAAYRMGVGIVKIYTCETNRQALFSLVPEAILSCYRQGIDEKNLIEDLKWADAVAIGPGIGTEISGKRLLDIVLKNAAIPMVLDADAINILALDEERLIMPHTDLVLTPHLGEMSRLTDVAVSYIQNNLIEVAEAFANQYDVILCLKDFRTVTAVPYGMTYLNLSGNPGMATAGSGDVLTGIIGALLAQGVEAKKAAPLGSYIHGLAGNLALNGQNSSSIMASDLVENLKKI